MDSIFFSPEPVTPRALSMVEMDETRGGVFFWPAVLVSVAVSAGVSVAVSVGTR
jgi:uncharacterized membrane-anchored protein